MPGVQPCSRIFYICYYYCHKHTSYTASHLAVSRRYDQVPWFVNRGWCCLQEEETDAIKRGEHMWWERAPQRALHSKGRDGGFRARCRRTAARALDIIWLWRSKAAAFFSTRNVCTGKRGFVHCKENMTSWSVRTESETTQKSLPNAGSWRKFIVMYYRKFIASPCSFAYVKIKY